MAADVTAQLGELDGGVVALRALVRLLVRVPVAHVAHQLTCNKRPRHRGWDSLFHTLCINETPSGNTVRRYHMKY